MVQVVLHAFGDEERKAKDGVHRLAQVLQGGSERFGRDLLRVGQRADRLQSDEDVVGGLREKLTRVKHVRAAEEVEEIAGLSVLGLQILRRPGFDPGELMRLEFLPGGIEGGGVIDPGMAVGEARSARCRAAAGRRESGPSHRGWRRAGKPRRRGAKRRGRKIMARLCSASQSGFQQHRGNRPVKLQATGFPSMAAEASRQMRSHPVSPLFRGLGTAALLAVFALPGDAAVFAYGDSVRLTRSETLLFQGQNSRPRRKVRSSRC